MVENWQYFAFAIFFLCRNPVSLMFVLSSLVKGFIEICAVKLCGISEQCFQ